MSWQAGMGAWAGAWQCSGGKSKSKFTSEVSSSEIQVIGRQERREERRCGAWAVVLSVRLSPNVAWEGSHVCCGRQKARRVNVKMSAHGKLNPPRISWGRPRMGVAHKAKEGHKGACWEGHVRLAVQSGPQCLRVTRLGTGKAQPWHMELKRSAEKGKSGNMKKKKGRHAWAGDNGGRWKEWKGEQIHPLRSPAACLEGSKT